MSNSGTWFQNIAQILLVYRMTGSPFLVGVVNFSQFAAVVLLAPVAGNAADRFDRRALIVAMQVCAAILATFLCIITAAGLESTPLVIGVALLLGVTVALAIPAMQAIVPSLVARDELPSAVALSAVTFNLARAVGPAAGVLVIAQWGIPAALAVNACSYLALVAALAFIRPIRTEVRTVRDAPPRLRDSFRLVRLQPALYAPLIVVGLLGLSADPVNTLTPVFATEVLGRADTFTGFLVGAFGCGAVASIILAGRLHPTYRTMGLTLSVMGAGMGAFALSTSEPIALGGLFVGGFGYLSSVTAATSLLQLALEDEHRGRVMALWSLSFLGVRPVASVVDGALASLAGLRLAGFVMAVPVIAGGVWMMTLTGESVRRDAVVQGSSEPADT